MTQTPDEPMPEGTAKPRGISPVFWILGGWGCLGVGLPIMGILAAIIILSLLDVSSRPRSSEAKATLGYVSRAQQVYHLENGVFSKSLEPLDMKFSPQFFAYKVVPNASKLGTFTTAIPVDPNQTLKSYVGFVFLINPATSEFIYGICETHKPSQKPPSLPLPPPSPKKPVKCPPGSSLL
jgi:type II secretory pathway pseudopilin PulG